MRILQKSSYYEKGLHQGDKRKNGETEKRKTDKPNDLHFAE